MHAKLGMPLPTLSTPVAYQLPHLSPSQRATRVSDLELQASRQQLEEERQQRSATELQLEALQGKLQQAQQQLSQVRAGLAPLNGTR